MPPKANTKNSAVKRIMQEAKELADDESTDYRAAPLDDNLFEWHATIRGAPDTEFEGGRYHLRILLPASYPFSAPDIMLLTPNGRFETSKKICIDGLTSFHEGSWQPAWGVRTAIVGLLAFWNAKGEALQSVGALDYPREERKRLAKISKDWRCEACAATCGEMLPYSPAVEVRPTASTSSTPSSLSGAPIGQVKASEEWPNGPADSPSTASGVPEPPSSSTPVDPPPATAPQTPTPIPLASEPPSPLPEPRPTNSIPTVFFSAPAPPPHPGPPLWIDAVLFIGVSLVVLLLARRLI